MNSDIEKIRSFLTDLREEISELLKIKEKVFRIYFHDSMNEAWPGVKEALSNLSESLFQEDNFRSEEISESSILPLLKNAGLTEAQLDLKLHAFYKSRDRWHRAKEVKFGNALLLKKSRWRKSLKSMLSWGKLLVGSLTSSLSSLKLPIEMIKEFLEFLELALLDSE